ncbi:MAG: non-heme Fe2+,alpha-ketoglutarate-dependent halogenase [Gammaproteobacteria bacterium]
MSSTILNDIQIAQYERDGYVSPIPVLSAAQANELRARLEKTEQAQGGALYPGQRSKSYILFKWLNDLVRDARVLDPVEQLIGPNILIWNTIFWVKEAGSKSFVSWHQDTQYWGLSNDKVVTAWIALSPAPIEAGCMRIMPGTHRRTLRHEDRYHNDNMLTRGQEIDDGLDENDAVHMPLAAGEMSIHNYCLAHASGPNDSTDRRIGISLHFLPPDTKQIVGDWDCATLVRGTDPHHHFEDAAVPSCDLDPAVLAYHEKASRALSEVLYTGAAVKDGKL